MLSAQEGYGKINPEAFRKVQKESLQTTEDFRKGQIVNLQDAQGNKSQAIVWAIDDATVTFNFNHPLAGKKLVFDVAVIDAK